MKGKRPCRGARHILNKMNKILTKISSASAALLAAGMAVTPVCAAGITYTPVTGESTSFTSTINVSATANVPNVTFSYDVAAGAAQAASDGNLAIYAGNDGTTSVGLPSIANVTFSAADAKTTDTTVVKEATVDFSGVSFKEPGVYRYVVTEQDSTAQGITSEEDKIKALDVYVTDNNGVLEVSGYVMHNDENSAAKKLDATARLDDKDVDFEHSLATSDLTISKTVTGNQASHDEYFEFTVALSGADEGAKYTVDLSAADATTSTNGINTEAHTNPAEIVIGADGSATATFWIQHGQSVVIQGIGNNTKYEITEANRDYEVSEEVTGDEDAVKEGAKVTDAALTADTEVAYTNSKSGAVPTGLFMGVGGASVMLIGSGLAIVAKNKKKKDEE